MRARLIGLISALALVASGCNKDDSDNTAANKLCLDRPDRITAMPNGQLPCELLPPGVELKAK